MSPATGDGTAAPGHGENSSWHPVALLPPAAAPHGAKKWVVVGHLQIKPTSPLLPDHSNSDPIVYPNNFIQFNIKHHLVSQLNLLNEFLQKPVFTENTALQSKSTALYFSGLKSEQGCHRPLRPLIISDGREGHFPPQLRKCPNAGAAASVSPVFLRPPVPESLGSRMEESSALLRMKHTKPECASEIRGLNLTFIIYK